MNKVLAHYLALQREEQEEARLREQARKYAHLITTWDGTNGREPETGIMS